MNNMQRHAILAAWRQIKCMPNITLMERMQFAPISKQRIHGGARNTYELLHVIYGEDRVITQHGHTLLKPSDTLLITGMAHRDQFDIAKGLEVFEICFTWPAGKVLLAALSPTPYKIRSMRGRREAAGLIEAMQGDLAWGREPDQRVAQSRLLTLLFVMAIDCLDRGRDARPGGRALRAGLRQRVLVQKACVYIDTHYQEPVVIDHMARALGVSRYYLARIFKAELDCSLIAFLTRVRMEQAKTLLSRGRINVDEAARAVGYQDSRYFIKVFHKHFGFAPGLLRV